MRVAINLATRPYVELERLLRQLRMAIGALALLAVGLGIWLHGALGRSAQQQRQLAVLTAQADALDRERAANEARLRQPGNAATLARNQFLNTLFARKGFSWTAVLMDLESVLPGGVQVQSIEPIVSPGGDVSIRLRVLGDRDRTVQLVRNLEGSQRFLSPRLQGEAQQTANTSTSRQSIGANGLPQPGGVVATAGALPPVSGVEFEILSGYNPLQARLHDRNVSTAQRIPAAEEVSR